LYAANQKAVLDRTKLNTAKPYKKTIPDSAKDDAGTITNVYNNFKRGKLLKAKQLKDYVRANALCFMCGEKFAPGLKAMQGNEI
jgi:hypothetical protein